jgi:hypothetical protein
MHGFEGKIEDFPIGEILQVVAMGRKTGTLIIESEWEQVSIYFLEGKAIYANPGYHRERLGETLIKNGVVVPGDVEKALTRQRELTERGEQIRIGSILVSMGVLTEEELLKYVTEQITEALYLIITEYSGTFKFLPGIDLSKRDVIVELDIEKTILDGMWLIDEWRAIERKLGDFNDVYAAAAELPGSDPVRLTVDEWKIFNLLDGRKSVNDVIRVAELCRLEVCKIIYDLINLGLVRKLNGDEENELIRSGRVSEEE